MDELLSFLYQYWEGVKTFWAEPPKLLRPDILIRMVLQVVLFTGSSFFSGSETALFSLSRLDLQRLRRQRHPQSGTLHSLLDQPRRLIISILCGNEIVNIAASANMTGILASLYGAEQAAWIATVVMVPLLLLFGEVTPKTIAVSDPVKVSTRIVAAPLSVWVRLIAPLSRAVRVVADRMTTVIVGKEKAADNILQIDELRTLVDRGVLEGEMSPTERALIYNLLRAGSTEIVEIMTPRTRVGFIDGSASVPEMVDSFFSQRHPRVPVYRRHRDNIVGFLHVEDLQRLIFDRVDFSTLKFEDIVRPPVMVPPTKRVDELLDFFQRNDTQAACVLNEFGGVDGFISMRDVLTFVFGQVYGMDPRRQIVEDREGGFYDVPGGMKLVDLNNLTNLGLKDSRMTTVGGLVLRNLDRLPRANDEVSVEGVVIKVLEMDAHRVARVRLSRGTPADTLPKTDDTTEKMTSGKRGN
jgi:CBS domain containing-hemolysin-like protein